MMSGNIPHSGLDGLRLLRDSDEELIMREHWQFPVLLVSPNTIQAEG